VLNYNYGTSQGVNDALSRISWLIDNDGVTHLADYSYLCASAIIQVNESQPGVQYTLIGIQSGNDQRRGTFTGGSIKFGRSKRLDLGAAGQLVIVQFFEQQFQFGRRNQPSCAFSTATTALETASGGKTWSPRVYNAGFDESYGYDGLYRLKTVNRGTLDSTQTGIVPGKGTFNQCWSSTPPRIGGAFREDDTGSGIWNTVQSRSANSVNEINGNLEYGGLGVGATRLRSER